MKKIIAAIDNVHMGLGHEGLGRLAKKFHADPSTLDNDGIVLFLKAVKASWEKIAKPGAGAKGY